MLLGEISVGGSEQSDDALRALAVAEFTAACPLSPYLQFYSHIGNADSPRRADGDMNAGSTRTIATNYNAVENSPLFAATLLRIYGGLVQTDRAHERRGTDIGSQRTRDLANFSRSLGRYFCNAVVNDVSTATTFSGLKEQCTTLSRKTVYGGVNGGSLPTGNSSTDRKNQDAFFESLNTNLFDVQGGAQVLIANGDFIGRLLTLGKDYVQTPNAQDLYGASHTITSYRGIPIVNAGFAANSTSLVIGNDETEGTSTDCTSVYAVRFGEEEDATFATNKGLDVVNLGAVGTKYQTMVEFDIDFVVLNAKAIKRISGIRLFA